MAKVIAEPCIYWHGDTNLLNDYIIKAGACGSDFFKLQLFHPSHLAAPRWKEKKKFFENNFISDALLKEVHGRTEAYGMQLVATVNDTEAIKRCHNIGVQNIKIASGQIIDPIIASITEFKWKRIFVSTGMLQDEIPLQMISWLTDVTDDLIVMHCVSLYPTEYSECNLNRIYDLREYFKENDNVSVGYSDHGYDDLACLFALGMGVPFIEKHFRISGSFGPTIEVAADETEFAELCSVAKQQDKILGKGGLKMQPREKESIEHYQGRYLV